MYRGLAGVFLVRDDEEAALPLPPAEQELVLVLQDRLFDSQNQLTYDFHPVIGLLGDTILVNGQLPRPIEVREGSYRLRLLNGSNSRIYKLAWSDGTPMIVIGSDGGLLSAPSQQPYMTLAPAERVELWADFGRAPRGPDVILRSLAFEAASPGGMMRMMGGRGMGPRGGPLPGVQQGAAFDVQPFRISGKGARSALPRSLTRIDRLPAAAKPPLRVTTLFGHMQWTLSGRTFQLRTYAQDERVELGSIVEWQLENATHMMAMAHPIHLHGPSFQCFCCPGSGFACELAMISILACSCIIATTWSTKTKG